MIAHRSPPQPHTQCGPEVASLPPQLPGSQLVDAGPGAAWPEASLSAQPAQPAQLGQPGQPGQLMPAGIVRDPKVSFVKPPLAFQAQVGAALEATSLGARSVLPNIKSHPDEAPLSQHEHQHSSEDGQTSLESAMKSSPREASHFLDLRDTALHNALLPGVMPLPPLSSENAQQLGELQKHHEQQLSDLQRQHYEQIMALKDQQLREFLYVQQQLVQQEQNGVQDDAKPRTDQKVKNEQSPRQFGGMLRGGSPDESPSTSGLPRPNPTPRFPAQDRHPAAHPLPDFIGRPILPRIVDKESPRANGQEESGWDASWKNVRHIQLSALATAITSPYKSFRGKKPPDEESPSAAPIEDKKVPDKGNEPTTGTATAGGSPPTRVSSSPQYVRDRSYACHLCPKAFTLKTHLDAHLRRHAGERPHLCTQCGKRFIERGGLVKHERIHSGERPFKCTECNAAFAENSNLKRHLRTHTTHRPYRCKECPAAYAQRNDLLNHQHIHSGEQKQFACDKCSASFERKAHLNRHFNMIHRCANNEQKPLTLVSVHPGIGNEIVHPGADDTTLTGP